MCVGCARADDFVLVAEARETADLLLGRYLRLDVVKAMRLGTPASFDRAVARLARLLQSRASNSDHAAVKAAVSALNVNWARTTAEQRRTLIARALEESGRKTRDVPAKVQMVFDEAAAEVVRAARDGARRDQKLAIAADFNAIDERVIRHLQSSQANYVRDEYGRRHEAFAKEARRVVAEGLEAGLGRDDIAADLERAAEGILAGRSSFYWEVVAGAFVGRGRSFAQLSAYAEAAITRYRIVAVLDEVTTPTCRFLDGKTFSVRRGLELFEQVEAHPERIEELNPWVRESVDRASGKRSLTVERGGERIAIAEIVRAGTGARDDRGAFSQALGETELGDVGIGFPPYHGLCRTTTVGEVSTSVAAPRVDELPPEQGKPETNSPLELLEASTTLASSSGQALALDGGFVENFDVQFRTETIEGRDVTKVRFKVTSQHAESVRKAILASTNVNRNDVFVHVRGERDAKTGHIIKGGERGHLRFQAVSGSIGKVRVRMVTEKGALTNFVEMDIPTTKASEVFRLYGGAASKLGITDATSSPSAAALDVLRKARLITQYDRQGWEELRKLDALTPEKVEPIFQKTVRRFPEVEGVLADTKLVQTARGHVALFSEAQAARLRTDGVVGIIHDLSDPRALVDILGDPDGSGLLSSTQRFNRGLFAEGMSTSADFQTGGADGVFTRLVVQGQKNKSFGAFKARVLIGPDQLGRLDWYFFNHDNFGRAGPEQFAKRSLIPEMKTKAFARLSPGNEAVFQHGIPLEAIRGVVISDAGRRKQIIDGLRRRGVTRVNGQPLERFITSKETF